MVATPALVLSAPTPLILLTLVYMTLHPHQRPLATTVARWARRLAFLTTVVVACAAVAPSTYPTPIEASAPLQTRPELVAQLRDRLTTNGLTPEQVRARPKAEGYPENLLEAYMGGANTAVAGALSASVFSAIRALGIIDARDLDELQPTALELWFRWHADLNLTAELFVSGTRGRGLHFSLTSH